MLVIDELPYLLTHSPELESVIQHAVDESRDRNGTRIVLSGSSLAVMGGLLDGSRPLRGQTSLSHAFRVLTEAGFLTNAEGLLSGRDPLYRLVDPIIAFIYSCVEPWRPLAEDGRRQQAWDSASPAWSAQILGPHLETLARSWVSRFAAPESIGGTPGIVGRAEMADPTGRVSREIDVVIIPPGEPAGRGAAVQAIGEAKLTADVDAIHHLDRCAELLVARGHGRPQKLIVFCETASPAFRKLAKERREITLVDLQRLYGGH